MKSHQVYYTLFFCWAVLAGPIRADETFSVLKVGSETYSNVVVTSVSATDIYFKFDKGVANAKLKKLDRELQAHFRAAAVNADAIEKKRLAAAQFSASQPNVTRVEPSDAKPAEPAQATNARSMDVNQAIDRVKAIINQPVTKITRTRGMKVSTYKPGWFHEGAIKPDFKNVDIRKTQDISYGQHQYVTSDLNPGIVFKGSDV
jgi:hypothetical protein